MPSVKLYSMSPDPEADEQVCDGELSWDGAQFVGSNGFDVQAERDQGWLSIFAIKVPTECRDGTLISAEENPVA